ncbi:MAG: hypothetical protein MUE73_16035 [Planctomycetes bacterium]|jgi:tetratricopeptide (TPR) repeat protein|nr:hypothetical protein [Planctomycetota bacterium]
MPTMERAISAARYRILAVRLTGALVIALPGAIAAAALLSGAFLLLGRPPLGVPFLAAAAGFAAFLSAAILLFRPVPPSLAAAEADRALGLDERLSTVLALRRGRAGDPLGLGGALREDAERAVRRADLGRLRRAIPRPSLLPALLALPLAAVFLLLATTAPRAAGLPPGAPSPEALRTAQVALRRLEQRAAVAETAARLRAMPEAAALAALIRDEAARLAAEHPRPAEAVARLGALERTARDAARRFAGLPPPDGDPFEATDLEHFAALAEALRALENADPSSLRPRITALLDRLREAGGTGLNGAAAAEAAALAEALRALGALGAALGDLASPGAASGASPGAPHAGLDPAKLARLAEAAEALRRLLEERERSPEDPGRAEAEARSYRLLQMTDEEIEQMIRAMEELRRMLEMGEEAALARAAAGGLGLVPLRGAGSALPVAVPGTGGAGAGRGGLPPVRADTTPTRPDFLPGLPGPRGAVTLIRTVRRLPAPDAPPAAFLELRRAAAREAEEALRRGDIPRRYRGVVRRYFADPGDGR